MDDVPPSGVWSTGVFLKPTRKMGAVRPRPRRPARPPDDPFASAAGSSRERRRVRNHRPMKTWSIDRVGGGERNHAMSAPPIRTAPRSRARTAPGQLRTGRPPPQALCVTGWEPWSCWGGLPGASDFGWCCRVQRGVLSLCFWWVGAGYGSEGQGEIWRFSIFLVSPNKNH